MVHLLGVVRLYRLTVKEQPDRVFIGGNDILVRLSNHSRKECTTLFFGCQAGKFPFKRLVTHELIHGGE
jgi:hypothetical protein